MIRRNGDEDQDEDDDTVDGGDDGDMNIMIQMLLVTMVPTIPMMMLMTVMIRTKMAMRIKMKMMIQTMVVTMVADAACKQYTTSRTYFVTTTPRSLACIRQQQYKPWPIQPKSAHWWACIRKNAIYDIRAKTQRHDKSSFGFIYARIYK